MVLVLHVEVAAVLVVVLQRTATGRRWRRVWLAGGGGGSVSVSRAYDVVDATGAVGAGVCVCHCQY